MHIVDLLVERVANSSQPHQLVAGKVGIDAVHLAQLVDEFGFLLVRHAERLAQTRGSAAVAQRGFAQFADHGVIDPFAVNVQLGMQRLDDHGPLQGADDGIGLLAGELVDQQAGDGLFGVDATAPAAVAQRRQSLAEQIETEQHAHRLDGDVGREHRAFEVVQHMPQGADKVFVVGIEGRGQFEHQILGRDHRRAEVAFAAFAVSQKAHGHAEKSGDAEGLIVAHALQMAANGFRAHVDAKPGLGKRTLVGRQVLGHLHPSQQMVDGLRLHRQSPDHALLLAKFLQALQQPLHPAGVERFERGRGFGGNGQRSQRVGLLLREFALPQRPVALQQVVAAGAVATRQRVVDALRPVGQHRAAVQCFAQQTFGTALLQQGVELPALHRRAAMARALLQQGEPHDQPNGQQIDDVGRVALRPVVMLGRGPPAHEAGPAVQAGELAGEIGRPVLGVDAHFLHDMHHSAFGIFDAVENAPNVEPPKKHAGIAPGDFAPGRKQPALAPWHAPGRLVFVEKVQTALDHQFVEFVGQAGAPQGIDRLGQGMRVQTMLQGGQ